MAAGEGGKRARGRGCRGRGWSFGHVLIGAIVFNRHPVHVDILAFVTAVVRTVVRTVVSTVVRGMVGTLVSSLILVILLLKFVVIILVIIILEQSTVAAIVLILTSMMIVGGMQVLMVGVVRVVLVDRGLFSLCSLLWGLIGHGD